jgi:hypothetical protein
MVLVAPTVVPTDATAQSSPDVPSPLGAGDYQTSQRGLFFKASYLHRF